MQNLADVIQATVIPMIFYHTSCWQVNGPELAAVQFDLQQAAKAADEALVQKEQETREAEWDTISENEKKLNGGLKGMSSNAQGELRGVGERGIKSLLGKVDQIMNFIKGTEASVRRLLLQQLQLELFVGLT